MQIKKFQAEDMAGVLGLIKKEFGSEAVILSARDISHGSGILGFMKGPGVEVTAATDTGCRAPKIKGPLIRRYGLYNGEPGGSPTTGLTSRRRSIPLFKGVTGGLKNGLRPKKVGNKTGQRDVKMSFLNFYQEMLGQGVEEDIAADLVAELNDAASSDRLSKTEDIKPCLIDILKRMGATTAPPKIRPREQKIMALIGPTGVGKTTTVAKLAAIEALQNGMEVGVLAIDDARVGSISQLEAYSRIIGVQMEVAANRQEVKESLRRLKTKNLILIDTPGISQKRMDRLRELKDLLDKIQGLEICFLSSAATKEMVFEDIFEKFGIMPIKRLIFTKLDESIEYGAVLNQLIRTKVPASYFTNGQEIPENIESATLERLVDLILVRKGGERDRRDAAGASKSGPGEQEEYRFHSSGLFVANRNSDIFHNPDCKWAAKISRENVITFESRAEAMDKDFQPCRVCNPAQEHEADSTWPITDRKEDDIRTAACR